MGLDGISVNHLRLKPENTSKENAIHSDMLAKSQDGLRSVNSLDKKGAIDAEDKENTSFFGGESAHNDEEEENEQTSEESFEFEKPDLTNSEVYQISVEENTSSLTIYNKKTDTIVQKITPAELSTLVDNLKNPGGIIVNKRI